MEVNGDKIKKRPFMAKILRDTKYFYQKFLDFWNFEKQEMYQVGVGEILGDVEYFF